MRKRARTDLCGGRSAMVVPTATVSASPATPNVGSSFFTRPSADESAAVFGLPPTSDPAWRGSPLTPGEHVLRRDVANRAVQADVVVMLDVALHQTSRIIQ